MTRAPLGDADAATRVDAAVRAWAAQWRADSFVGEIEHHASPDARGHFHWIVRLRGEEKSIIAVWLALRQRSVHVETEVVSAPGENREALYRFLLVKNYELRELHVAIGPEDGVYLVATVPVGELTVERLDELMGATVTYVDEIYPTAMTLALGSLYRRRGSRQ